MKIMRIKLKSKTEYLTCNIVSENKNNLILQVVDIDKSIKNMMFDKLLLTDILVDNVYYININDDIFHKVDVKKITKQNENNIIMDGIVFGDIKLNSKNVTKFDINVSNDNFKILREKK